MASRLIRFPRIALVMIAVSAAVTFGLGLVVRDGRLGTSFDDATERFIGRHVSMVQLRALLHVTDPLLIVGVLAAVVIASLLARRFDIALLAVLAPSVATLVTEVVLKPLVHRTYGTIVDGHLVGSALAYPSGHQTGVTSTVVVLVIIVTGSSVDRGWKIAALGFLAIVPLVAAVALVGNHYHYATDTIGALGVSVAIPLTLALAIDAIATRTHSSTQLEPAAL